MSVSYGNGGNFYFALAKFTGWVTSDCDNNYYWAELIGLNFSAFYKSLKLVKPRSGFLCLFLN